MDKQEFCRAWKLDQREFSEPVNWISGNFAEPGNWISGNFTEPGNWVSGIFAEPGNWIRGNFTEPKNWISRIFVTKQAHLWNSTVDFKCCLSVELAVRVDGNIGGFYTFTHYYKSIQCRSSIWTRL